MAKVMTALRTLFLLFLIAFTLRSMPWAVEVPRTHDEQYARVAASASGLSRVAWYAIAWTAFDAAVGWWLALRRRAPEPASAAPPPSAGT